ncbi:unannotated protein [freshwater metagenome]|uniref:Unannotated protein n=1 Tax=freshwater metagenome TaxID=449393 RepID=A0A6J7TZB4_9ZZZZ
MPTALNKDSAHARSASVHCALPQIADTPSPTNAGVFGIARTAAVVAPAADCNVATEIPAAIERTRGIPNAAADTHTAAASPGFTAISAPSPATTVALVRTPNVDSSDDRLSASSSTTVMLADSHPLATKPLTIAVPILPPPIMTSRGVCEVICQH